MWECFRSSENDDSSKYSSIIKCNQNCWGNLMMTYPCAAHSCLSYCSAEKFFFKMLSLAFFVELMSMCWWESLQRLVLLCCFCSFAAYFVRQPAGITYAMINSTVKIDCVVAGSASIPLWKINGTVYNIHLHPPVGVSYVPDGLMISPVLLQWNNTSFQCYVFGLTSTIGYLIVQCKPVIYLSLVTFIL